MEKRKVQVWIYFRAGAGLQVLLFKTTEKRGGFWQPVTGGVEEGEDFASAALREATEESGLAFGGAPRELGFEFSYKGAGSRAGVRFREKAFGLCVQNAPILPSPRLDPHEHVEYRWVTPDDARAMLRFDSNIQALEALVLKIAPQA